ncbi:MAG: RNA polymerase sigma factor [Thermoleophilia bacterium]
MTSPLPTAGGDGAHRAIEAVWRIESARVVAALARMTGDVGLAEDLAQDALVAALERWPQTGVPDNPGAWLTATAKNRGLDILRRDRTLRRKTEEIGRDTEMRQREEPDLAGAMDEAAIGDDLLALIFTCCHPVLSREAQVALTLRLLGGLTTAEIARAFLTPEPTIGQRISRAKKTLSTERVRFETPAGAELDARLGVVLAVVYLIFNEGHSASGGDAWVRPTLCEEAMRLGRILVALAPDAPEAHGLLALMELQASRLRARVGRDGRPVLLLDQDRGRWDRLLITRGLASLARAEELGGSFGPYTLQAALAACHARAGTAEETDWGRIAAIYGVLGRVSPSPVVELNRAVAVSMAEGPEAGLALADPLLSEPALAGYHLLPAARADMLARAGRTGEARDELERAASLAQTERERRLLRARAAGLD